MALCQQPHTSKNFIVKSNMNVLLFPSRTSLQIISLLASTNPYDGSCENIASFVLFNLIIEI